MRNSVQQSINPSLRTYVFNMKREDGQSDFEMRANTISSFLYN